MGVASHRFDNGLRYRDADHPRQTALTPEYILGPVRAALGGAIDLDPCATPRNEVGASAFYAPPQDGSALPWDAQTIFVNPPYGKAREAWIRRCMQAGGEGKRVVLLIPSHTDTRIFQEALQSCSSMLFIRGRVKFGVLRPNRRQVAASHPSVLIAWNVSLRRCESLGAICTLETSP